MLSLDIIVSKKSIKSHVKPSSVWHLPIKYLKIIKGKKEIENSGLKYALILRVCV